MFIFAPTSFIEGLATGFSLIIAIGAQNAFVLKQGILRNHVLPIITICILVDASLIAFGVGGFGAFLASNTTLLTISRFGGATFLAYYGIKSFRSAFAHSSLEIDINAHKLSLKSSVLTVLALSLLNPHVYLDTCVLIGSIGAQVEKQGRPSFAAGAMLASLVWFFALGYGAAFLIPLFKKPMAWKILDCIIGVVMLGIAFVLVC